MPITTRTASGIALLSVCVLLAVACGGDDTDEGRPASTSASPVTTASPTTSTTTAASTAPPTTAPTTTGPAATAPPTTAGAVMPDVVGLGLQVAQDRIQSAGVFYSRSFDCTGADRRQVLDRNWVVVTQSPAPGVPIGEGDALLGVVKLEEPRSCT